MVDKMIFHVIMSSTNTDKSIDEEEYIRFRMNREEMAGENFRDGRMEVAFELWIERKRRVCAGGDADARKQGMAAFK